MKQIKEIFSPQELSKDHRLIKQYASQKPRKYTRKYRAYTENEKKAYNPKDYRFRLVIFFKDQLEKPGYRGTWLKSIDKYNNGIIDEWEGFMKLERRIKHTYKGLYTRAIIYMGINGRYDYPVTHFYKDEEIFSLSNKPLVKVPFYLEGKNHLVNLENPKLLNDLSRWQKY
jgi:hypothetical protein